MRPLVLLLVLGLVAAACSDDPRPDAAASPTRAPATPSPSPTPEPTPAPTPRPDDPFEAAARWEAASAEELAAGLAEAETRLREGAGADAERLGRVHQAAYRQLVVEDAWREAAYEALPEELRATARAHVAAGEGLRRLTSPREQLPDHWRIVDPPSAEELLSAYRGAADGFGVGWEYLAAIHLVETRMGRIRGTSIAGAEGPMQFLPSTWEAYGEGDIDDPHDAIRAAARYLVAHGAPGDMGRALYAYNHSDAYVRAIETYAAEMRADPDLYDAYYHWQVYYRTTSGDALLEVGWGS